MQQNYLSKIISDYKIQTTHTAFKLFFLQLQTHIRPKSIEDKYNQCQHNVFSRYF